MDRLFPKLQTVLNFKVLRSTVQRSASGVQCTGFRVQCPESSVQGPASRVQRPESSVQSPASKAQRPESSIQSPASNYCVQSPGIPVCPDNLLACYAYAVIFICRFAEGHVILLQDFSFGYNFNYYIPPIQIRYISARALLYVFYVLFFVFLQINCLKKNVSVTQALKKSLIIYIFGELQSLLFQINFRKVIKLS